MCNGHTGGIITVALFSHCFKVNQFEVICIVVCLTISHSLNPKYFFSRSQALTVVEIFISYSDQLFANVEMQSALGNLIIFSDYEN